MDIQLCRLESLKPLERPARRPHALPRGVGGRSSGQTPGPRDDSLRGDRALLWLPRRPRLWQDWAVCALPRGSSVIPRRSRRVPAPLPPCTRPSGVTEHAALGGSGSCSRTLSAHPAGECECVKEAAQRAATSRGGRPCAQTSPLRPAGQGSWDPNPDRTSPEVASRDSTHALRASPGARGAGQAACRAAGFLAVWGVSTSAFA